MALLQVGAAPFGFSNVLTPGFIYQPVEKYVTEKDTSPLLHILCLLLTPSKTAITLWGRNLFEQDSTSFNETTSIRKDLAQP